MGITVVTPAADKLLTTVLTVKAELGITDDDSDSLLEHYIEAASQQIMTFTGRDFAQETVKETMGSVGMPHLLLSRTPIVSITSVTFQGDEVTDYSLIDANAGIVFKETGWFDTSLPWNTFSLEHPSPYVKEDWEFTYIGGFVLPNWATVAAPRTLPHDLERACIEMVKSTRSKSKIDDNIKRYKVDDVDVTWGGSSSVEDIAGMSFSPTVRSILNYYRRAY